MTENELSPEIREALRHIARLDAHLRAAVPVVTEVAQRFNAALGKGIRDLNEAYAESLRQATIQRKNRADS